MNSLRIESEPSKSSFAFHPMPNVQSGKVDERALSNQIFFRSLVVLFAAQLILSLSTSFDDYFAYQHQKQDPLAAKWPFFIQIKELGWLFFVPAIAYFVSNVKLSVRTLVLGLFTMALIGVIYSAMVIHPLVHLQLDIFTNQSSPFTVVCFDCLRKPGVWFDEVFGAFVHVLGLGATALAIRFSLETEAKNRQAESMRRSIEQLRHNVLTNRLQPHFLFNTLNTISALTTTRPERAQEMVGKLGALLRNSIESMDQRDIQLRQEYSLVSDYLAIQRIRFGDRLTYELELPPSLTDIKIPAFILQPLVENSVKHGIDRNASSRSDAVNIHVSTKLSNELVEISVSDDGCGFDVDTDSIEQHLGLGLTRERLDLQYGTQAGVNISSSEGGGFSVTLTIPASNGAKNG